MNPGRLLPRLLLLLVAAVIDWAALYRDRLDVEALDASPSGLGLPARLDYLPLYIAGLITFMPGILFALPAGPVWPSLLNLVGATRYDGCGICT